MKYCKKCGSELKGIRKFCTVCGSSQDKTNGKLDAELAGEPIKRKRSQDAKEGTCLKCGEETDKKCFFCDDFVCRVHYVRMQANIHSLGKMDELRTQDESKRINEGWRGYIIYSCPKCVHHKIRKPLTDEETKAINTLNECTWYKMD